MLVDASVSAEASAFSLSHLSAFYYPKHKRRDNKPRSESDRDRDRDRVKEEVRSPIDVCITLMNDHRSMGETFMRKGGTRSAAMQRVDACHEIATAVTNWSGSKRAFTAVGFNRDAVLSDCAKGVHISARTLVCYGFVRNWSIWHCKGCVYFRTGDVSTPEPDYIVDYDVNEIISREKEANTESGDQFAARVSALREKCLELTNLAKPLRSVHAYKHPELLQMYQRVKWHIPSTHASSRCDQRSTKQLLYDALKGTVETF